MISKLSVVTSVRWTIVATMGRRVLALLANIAFARLLAPGDFGVVAMAGVLLGFIDIFKDLGTGAALVREKHLTQGLRSSVFWLNFGFGLSVTALVVLFSPLVAEFYHEPRVRPVMAAMALSFLMSSLSIVHTSVLMRDMAFDRLAKVELTASVTSYAVGLGAALAGQGVWALVWQVLTNTALATALIWAASGWRPSLSFNWAEVRGIMSYSLNLAGGNIFYYFSQNVDNLLIGRFLGTEALGLYDMAYKLMTFPMQAIGAVFGRVMAPYYAQAQDDLPRFRRAFLRVAAAIAFVAFPLMFGLFGTREHFVFAVFGAAWAPSIPLLALFAPLGAMRSVLTTTGSIFVACGHAALQLRWNVVSNLIICAGLAIGLYWGLMGVAAGFTLTWFLLMYHNFAIPLRLIGLRPSDLVRELRPTMACTALMLGTLALVDLLFGARLGHPALLVLQVAAGAASYTVCAWFAHRDMLRELLSAAGLRRPALATAP